MRTKESKGDVLDTAGIKNLTISSVLFPDLYCLFERPFLTKHAQIIPEQCPVFPSFHRKQLLQVSVHLFLLCQLKQKPTNIQD